MEIFLRSLRVATGLVREVIFSLHCINRDRTPTSKNDAWGTQVSSPAEYYLVPIDECYKLVGLIRTHWRGLSGGTEVWRELGTFFGGLKQRAGCGQESVHA